MDFQNECMSCGEMFEADGLSNECVHCEDKPEQKDVWISSGDAIRLMHSAGFTAAIDSKFLICGGERVTMMIDGSFNEADINDWIGE